MSLFKTSAMAVGTAALVSQVARLISAPERIDSALGHMGLARRHSTADRLLPALGLTVLGAAVGAGAALLCAPSSGAELRQRLSSGIDEAADKLKQASDKARRQISDVTTGNAYSSSSTHA